MSCPAQQAIAIAMILAFIAGYAMGASLVFYDRSRPRPGKRSITTTVRRIPTNEPPPR